LATIPSIQGRAWRLRNAARGAFRVGLLGGLASPLAHAQELYSFDRGTEELVLIDSQAGTVTPVVTVQTAGAVVQDLVTLADRLYLKAATQLLELDRTTGSILSAVTMRLNGQAVLSEGITSDGTDLYVAYVSTSQWPFTSDTIGRLALDGTITSLVYFPIHGGPPGDEGADFDALTIDPTASDRWLGLNNLNYTDDSQDRTDSFRGGIDGSFAFLAGSPALVFALGMTTTCGTVWVLSQPVPGPLTPYLHRIDPVTGSVLQSIALPVGRDLVGLTGSGPRADAGADQVVGRGALVTLDGTGSVSPCGGLTFHWTQVAGTPVVLNMADPARPTFTAPNMPGARLLFELVVDNGVVSPVDVVSVSVKAKQRPSGAPAPLPLSVGVPRVGGHLRLAVASSDEIAFALVSGGDRGSVVHGSAGSVVDGLSTLAIPLPDDPSLAGARLRVRAALRDPWTRSLRWSDEVEIVLLEAGFSER
jgi:hypothetical protein